MVSFADKQHLLNISLKLCLTHFTWGALFVWATRVTINHFLEP